MSFYSFKAADAAGPTPTKSLRAAYSTWLLATHGAHYRATVSKQRNRPKARQLQASLESATPAQPRGEAMVGIAGAGFAGLYAGLILQSLGIECEVFESSDRVGGRIRTWYSSDHAAGDKNKTGLYGELGGMRLPQFSLDMLPVQQLALAVNAVLGRNGLSSQQVNWRKFYYDSPQQRLRFNDMPAPIDQRAAPLNGMHFDEENGGDIAQVWMTQKTNAQNQPYLPINQILQMVNTPYIDALNRSFGEGLTMLMQYDQYSMWDYLTTVFTLGDLGEYYDPAMGAKSDLLPWSIASYLETTNVGSGMYAVSFVEMVIAVYDWGGSKNPYAPDDDAIYMLTVDQGMQRFPDACRAVLDLAHGVERGDGHLAQVQVGMLPAETGGPYAYSAPNIVPDTGTAAPRHSETRRADGERKQRVFLQHRVVEMQHDAGLYEGHGGMRVRIKNLAATESEPAFIDKKYPYVITTLPNGAYLNGELKSNLLNRISFAKAQALRECDYMASFKAFLTFKTQFWAKLGERPDQGMGAASTDRPNRQIIYPSYGYEGTPGVLQIYCWAQDARRLGALDDEQRVAECLKGIAFLYPEVDVYEQFSGYHPEKTTKTWFWDEHDAGGAFALFNPGQFKHLYPTLLTPEFGGCLNFAGEACSVHHGWIVGALDSAYNAVYHVLRQAGAAEKIEQMVATWGSLTSPDVAPDTATVNLMTYAHCYNLVDRRADSVAPGLETSIYGDSTYEFDGAVPAFVNDFATVPQTMLKTANDKQVLRMLNKLWDENVAQRSKVRAKSARPHSAARLEGLSAAEMLEQLYYADNFQTIPAPRFWLKDDAEFARQQLAGFMPNLLTRVSLDDLRQYIAREEIPDAGALGNLADVTYVADYRRYLQACTVIPEQAYLAKPIVFFRVTERQELMPVGIQLEAQGPLFTPGMPNAANAWLLAKMLTNCAGQTLHDVGFHQLLTHQLCAMVSVALFSEEVFNPRTAPGSTEPYQQHPVFKLLRPHLVKAAEFAQSVYNSDFKPSLPAFPATRDVSAKPGVYNLGFVYDLIFSCGRIGNYQLQDKIYGDPGFRFLEHAIPKDAAKRGVLETPFSYAYVHDTSLWYDAMASFVGEFVDTHYAGGDAAVARDVQLQNFFTKLIPAFNFSHGRTVERFPDRVNTTALLKEVLTMFMWQFSVQHTVVNDGAYNHAAFVPNASTLMSAPPDKPASSWTAADVLGCMPSETTRYAALGDMTFTDIQINASVTGQGPYPETVLGRGLLAPAIDVLQDTYSFSDPALRATVDHFYQRVREVGEAIALRQARDTARYISLHPDSDAIPPTVVFDLVNPTKVMNAIVT